MTNNSWWMVGKWFADKLNLNLSDNSLKLQAASYKKTGLNRQDAKSREDKENMLTNVRDELIKHLERLSDLAYQRRAWINKDFPPGIEYDDPDLVIHFLYDETGIADNPESGLNNILWNSNEVIAIKNLIEKLDLVLDNYDVGFISPKEYIQLPVPEWQMVIEAAKEALVIFREVRSASEN